MKNVIVGLALFSLAGSGCISTGAKAPARAPATTTSAKVPQAPPVTPDDVTAANARQTAAKLQQELDTETARVHSPAQP